MFLHGVILTIICSVLTPTPADTHDYSRGYCPAQIYYIDACSGDPRHGSLFEKVCITEEIATGRRKGYYGNPVVQVLPRSIRFHESFLPELSNRYGIRKSATVTTWGPKRYRRRRAAATTYPLKRFYIGRLSDGTLLFRRSEWRRELGRFNRRVKK